MAIVASQLPIFPACPSYGFRSRPEFLVRITERSGGYEKRNLAWQEPIYFYDGAPMGPRPEEDIYRIYRFYNAMRGTHRRFRFKDWIDYKSTENMSKAVASSDQPFVQIDATHYQLVKQYDEAGVDPMVRRILHPIGSTLVVQNNSGANQVSTRWSIDEDTGILTTLGGFVGTPGGWGGEFYVPCRFAAAIEPEIADMKIQNLTCSLKSLRKVDT